MSYHNLTEEREIGKYLEKKTKLHLEAGWVASAAQVPPWQLWCFPGTQVTLLGGFFRIV